MGKSKGLQSEDVHIRVNYLYQAACQTVKQNPGNLSLCRFYVNTLTVIARRQGIHLHPDIKRTFCKRCCLLLVPGVTAIYRVKKKRQKQTVVTCLGCGTLRKFVCGKASVPWVDRPESWIETIVAGKTVTLPPQKHSAGDQAKNYIWRRKDLEVIASSGHDSCELKFSTGIRVKLGARPNWHP